MDARLERFIDMVRDISAESLPDEHMASAVMEEARTLAAEGCKLPPAQRATDGTTHGRHLLYEDPCTGFVVTAMSWPAGSKGAPHDHGTWGVVAVIEGELEVTSYGAPTGGPLEETGRVVAGPGAVATVVPPETDVHRMRNAGDAPALSIHVYGRAIAACHEFDENTGEARLVEPRWTSEPGVAAG